MTAFGWTVRSALDTAQALHILVDLHRHDPLLARLRFDLFLKPVDLLESGVDLHLLEELRRAAATNGPRLTTLAGIDSLLSIVSQAQMASRCDSNCSGATV
jgi:hypothetical protein